MNDTGNRVTPSGRSTFGEMESNGNYTSQTLPGQASEADARKPHSSGYSEAFPE